MSRIAPIFAPDLPSSAAATASESHTATPYRSIRLEDFTPGQGRADDTLRADLEHQNAISSHARVTGLDSSGLAAAPDSAPELYRAAALQYHGWGLNVLAVDRAAMLKGTKKPCHLWKGGIYKHGPRKGQPGPNWTTTRQTTADVLDFPWKNAGGVGVVNGIGGARTIDIDDCPDVPGVVAVILDAMGLPADYEHASVSGSDTGGRILVICPEELPADLAPSGVLSWLPRDAGTFDHIELRMRETITVVPPSEHKSGKVYRPIFRAPTQAPAVITRDQLISGMLAVAEPPKPKPQPQPSIRATLRDTSPDADYRRIIERVNDSESAIAYLIGRGATKRADGNYSCPCGAAHAGDGQITAGRTVIYCHSTNPACLLSKDTHKRGLDRWGLEVVLEHGGRQRDALLAHGWIEPEPTIKVGNSGPTPEQRAARAKDAERKRDARKQAAAELRADVEARAAADPDLTPCDHAVLDALLTIAGDRGWARPSKERLAEMSGYSVGSVKRALASPKMGGRLEGRYFTSEGDGGGPNCTAVRTFLRGSSFDTETIFVTKDDPRIVISSRDLYDPPVTCERGAGGSDPATLDEWEWQADAHGADELNALELFAASADPPAEVTQQPRNDSQPADRMGLSPKERYTLRRIGDGDVLRMERLPDSEPEGEQTAFVEPATPTHPQPSTSLDWAHLRYQRKQGRQRRLVRRPGPPVEVAPARRLPTVDLPAFLTGDVSPMLPAPSQALAALSPPLASGPGTAFDPAATIARLFDARNARASPS